MRVPRSRGALGGVLITLLGIWGALIPFVGPYFNYTLGSNSTWHWTTGRLWLSVLPGVVAIVGGLLLLTSRSRPTASFGALLGVAAGAWFVVGPVVSELWNHGIDQSGAPYGARGTRVLEQLGFHLALGAFILYFAAAALGRLSVRSVRDVELAQAEATGGTATVTRAAPVQRATPVRQVRPVAATTPADDGTATGQTEVLPRQEQPVAAGDDEDDAAAAEQPTTVIRRDDETT